MVVMASLPDILKKYENISQNKYTYKDLSKLNPFLENDDGDILYHIALGSKSHDLPRMFGDVKVIVLGGTPRRMEKFAHFLMKYIGYELPPGTTLNNISRCSHRYAMFKVGPILSVSHGTGTPSVGIVLNELIKLVYHARIKDPIFIKIGSSGGFNLPEGSIVVTKKVFNEYLETSYEMFVLGNKMKFSTELDESLVTELGSVSQSLNFDVTIGSTYCSSDFYEGSGRLDGAICEYTEEENARFFKLLHNLGIVNTEMESTVFAATTRRAGIKSALVTIVIDNKMAEDRRLLIRPKVLDEWQIKLFSIVSAFIKRHLVFEKSAKAREIKIANDPHAVSLTETYFPTVFRYGHPLRTTCAWSDSGRRATSPASNASETENWYDGFNTSNIPSNVTQDFPVTMNTLNQSNMKSKDNESIVCPKCGAHVLAESNESLNRYSESSESVCWKCGVVLELAFPSQPLNDDLTKFQKSTQCTLSPGTPTARIELMANESISMESGSCSKDTDKNHIATTHPMASPWMSDSDSKKLGRSKKESEDMVPYSVTSETVIEDKQNPSSSETFPEFYRKYATIIDKHRTDFSANSPSVSCGSSYSDAVDSSLEKSSTMSVRSSSLSSFAEETDISSNCGTSAQTTEFPLTKIPSTTGARDVPSVEKRSEVGCPKSCQMGTKIPSTNGTRDLPPDSKDTPGSLEQHSATLKKTSQSTATPDGSCPCLGVPNELPPSAKLEEKSTEIMSGKSQSTPSKLGNKSSNCPNFCQNTNGKSDKTSASKNNDAPPVAGGAVEGETPHICSTSLTKKQIKEKLDDPDWRVRITCPTIDCEIEGNEIPSPRNIMSARKKIEEPERNDTKTSTRSSEIDSKENHKAEEKLRSSTAIPSMCNNDGSKPKPLTGTALPSTTTPSTATTPDTNIKTESSVPDFGGRANGLKGTSQPEQQSGSNVVKSEESKEGSSASTLSTEDQICEPCLRKIDNKTSTKTEESRRSEERPDPHARCQRPSGLYCIKPSVTNKLDEKKTFPPQVSTTDSTKSPSSNLKTNTQASSDKDYGKTKSVSDVDPAGVCQRSNSDFAQKTSVKTAGSEVIEKSVDSSSSNRVPSTRNAAYESISKISDPGTLKKSVGSSSSGCTPCMNGTAHESTSKTSDQGTLKKSVGSSLSNCTPCMNGTAQKSTSKTSDQGTLKKSVGSSSSGCTPCMTGAAHESTSKTPDQGTLKKSAGSSLSDCLSCTKSPAHESTSKTSDQGTPKKSVSSISSGCLRCMNGTVHKSASKTLDQGTLKKSVGSSSSGCTPCMNGTAHESTSKTPDQGILKKSVDSSSSIRIPCKKSAAHESASKTSDQGTLKKSVGSSSSGCTPCTKSAAHESVSKTSDQGTLKMSVGSSSSGCTPCTKSAAHESISKTSDQGTLKKSVGSSSSGCTPCTKSAAHESISKTSDQGTLKKSVGSSSSGCTPCTKSAAHESISKTSDQGTLKKSVGSSSSGCTPCTKSAAHESISKTSDQGTLKKSVGSSSSGCTPCTKSAAHESIFKTSDQGTLKQLVGSSSSGCPSCMNGTAPESTTKKSNDDSLKKSVGSSSSGYLPGMSSAAHDSTSKISDQGTLTKSVGSSCVPCIDEGLQNLTSKPSPQDTSKTPVGSNLSNSAPFRAGSANTPTPKTSDQNLLKKSVGSSSSGCTPCVSGANHELTSKTSHPVNETTKESAQGSKVDDDSTNSKKTPSKQNSSSCPCAEKLLSTNLGGESQRERGSQSQRDASNLSRRKTKPSLDITPRNTYLDSENDDVFILERGPSLDSEMNNEIQRSGRVNCLSCTLHNDKTMSAGSSLISYLEKRDYMNERCEQEIITDATTARDSMSSLPCCNYHADLREKSKNLIVGSTIQIEDFEPCCSGYELLEEYSTREPFTSLHRQTLILSTPTTSRESSKSLIYGISVTPRYEREDIFSPSPCSLCKKFRENIKRCTSDILIDSQPEIIKCRHKLRRLKDECHGYD